MVCIAAFIILILVGIVVAFLSIFNRDLGRKYLKILKKAWHCFSRRLTFRKCDTKFSDDVKNVLLKKVVIKKPQLVKPLSVTIEIASILVVIVTAWSLVEAAKAGLALWVFGTCNVSQPANCALGAESCAIDEEDLNWFEEWGEIFTNIPDRLKTWNAADYVVDPTPILPQSNPNGDPALDLLDPGCSVCLQSYRNQLKSADFLDDHAVMIMLYPIKLADGSYKFKNSELTTRYFHALTLLAAKTNAKTEIAAETDADDADAYAGLDLKLLNRIFMEQDENGVNFQSLLNDELDRAKAEELIKTWLKEWGLDKNEIKTVAETAASPAVTERMAKIAEVVEEQIKPKGIPTLIYDGKKHLGLFKKR